MRNNMPIKLTRRVKGKREVLGVFKGYEDMAEFLEKCKHYGEFYAVPLNLKRVGAIRKVTRRKGDVGVHVEKYGWV